MAAATLMALGAALLHASWNLVLKAADDRLVAAWVQTTAGAVIFLPWLVVLGLPPRDAYPYLAASMSIHTLYALALVGAYNRADLSVAYPVARGIAPLTVAVGGSLLLADPLAPLGYAGVALVSLGLMRVGRGARGAGIALAVVTGLLISLYTLVDTAGVRAGGESLRYTVVLIAGLAVVLGGVVLARRSKAAIRKALRRPGWANAWAGVASLAAYALILWAVRLAPVGYVAALRESSVVFGVLGSWLLLKEQLGRRRIGGALLVAGGVALLVSLPNR